MTLRRVGPAIGIPLVGLLVGIAIAIASSLSSLNPDRAGESSGFVQPPPRALPSPSASPPTVAAPGLLGDSGRLVTNGSSSVIAIGSNVAMVSGDAGRTWSVVRPPATGSGLVVDPANPAHVITGGASIQITGNAGTSWSDPIKPPPGKGPYQPLAISPVEPNVWFFLHGNKLLLTRDGSATWTELNAPQVSNPILASGQSLGQFFVSSGTRVFQLTNYGQTISEKPSLMASVTELVAVGGTHPTLLARVQDHGVYRLGNSGWLPTGRGGPIASGAGGSMLVGNGGSKLGVQGVVSYSTDGGVTWSLATGLPFDQTVEAIAGQFDSRTFFAYCYGGDLYVSSDGGRTWSLLTNRLRAG